MKFADEHLSPFAEELELADQYEARFGHRVPGWACNRDTSPSELILQALASGEPVTEWRSYKPNPQNFRTLRQARENQWLRMQAASKVQIQYSPGDVFVRLDPKQLLDWD